MHINWFKDENHLVYMNGATQLAQLERALLKSERRTKRLAIALAVCVIFFTLLMAFDILNRDVGWFRGSFLFALGGVLP